jgi:hypothetical protein
MPIRSFSRALTASIETGSLGVLHKLVSFNGFRYGSLGEVPGATGISSSAPVETLFDQRVDA